MIDSASVEVSYLQPISVLRFCFSEPLCEHSTAMSLALTGLGTRPKIAAGGRTFPNDWSNTWALSDPRTDRRGRHGNCVPRTRCAPGARRRGEGPAHGRTG